jgi:hypothetical protein
MRLFLTLALLCFVAPVTQAQSKIWIENVRLFDFSAGRASVDKIVYEDELNTKAYIGDDVVQIRFMPSKLTLSPKERYETSTLANISIVSEKGNSYRLEVSYLFDITDGITKHPCLFKNGKFIFLNTEKTTQVIDTNSVELIAEHTFTHGSAVNIPVKINWEYIDLYRTVREYRLSGRKR